MNEWARALPRILSTYSRIKHPVVNLIQDDPLTCHLNQDGTRIPYTQSLHIARTPYTHRLLPRNLHSTSGTVPYILPFWVILIR